ncbi:ATP-dependent DNA helicase [Frankliniella fusca]|uniref:ATP-dependent DNA helicase n=1 Tax=Frankliniella fusca TaxID=407009 RepID=A0AAE1HIK7_9NEOP|nr:ATP-dependent DNA helicase [Frankliniella fusca]
MPKRSKSAAAKARAKADAYKRARERETAEEEDERRERNAEQMARARQQATPEEVEQRRAEDAQRHASARQHATPEQAEARRVGAAVHMAAVRQQATPEQAEARRVVDAARHAAARQQATPEEAEARRVVDAVRHGLARRDATPEQAQARRAQDADRHAASREQQSPEARDEARALDAARHANDRLLQTPEAADERRARAAALMMDVREAQTAERAVHNNVQRMLRRRAVNFDVAEDGGEGRAQGAAGPGAAAGAAGAAAGPGAARPATLEELFDATMAALSMNACPNCRRAVMTERGELAPGCRGGRCRKFSADNLMYPGEVPAELQGLTYIEQQLIARVHPVVSVYKVRGGQYGYSGNIINFPQDVQGLASTLPHRLADLTSLITVRTQGAEGHVDFKVRAGRVRAALVWLKHHHRYYRDVEISEENLNELPDDGDAFLQVRGIDERPRLPPAAAAGAAPGAAAAPPGGGPAEGPQAEEAEAGVHVTCMPMVQPVHQDDQVAATVNWPTIGQLAVNEFTTDGYITMAYPTLFPYGRADYLGGRPTKVNMAEYFRFLIEYSDRRFACHPTFRFFALNSMMRWSALTNGQVFVRNNPQCRDMTAADLRRAVQTNQRNILKQALYHGNKMKGTRQFWHARCGELLDMVNQLGVPTLFLTLSAADLHWEDLFRLLAPGEDVSTITDARRQKLVSTTNPGKEFPPADVHPCRKKFSQVVDPVRDLGELLNRVQRHKCSNGYCQRIDKATGQPVCRFKFPFQEEPITRLFENEQGLWELVTARNDSLLNKYIEWVITLWRANMDATPILSMGFILRYIAKYTAKGEPRSQPCAELVKAVLEGSGEADSAKSVIQKLLMKTVSERDYSAQEVCHILTGQPLHMSSRKFVVVNLSKTRWVPLREGGAEADAEEAVDDPAQAAEGAAARADAEADQAEQDDGVGDVAEATYHAFVQEYQTRDRPEMNNMTLFQVAKTFSLNRRKWTRNRKEAIVRVFPRTKLTGNDDRDEAYYRVQVLLHTAWRTEEQAKGAGTWKQAFEAAGLVAEQPAREGLAEAAAQIAAEEALFEEPDQAEGDEEGPEEWMVLARMGANNQAEMVPIGRREMDLAYDWHASSQAYGDHAALREFVSRHRETTRLEPEQEAMVDDVVYTPEQQKLIDLVQIQIDSVAPGGAPRGPGPVFKRVLIQGKAGCGKSTVVKKCVTMARQRLGPRAAKLMAPTAAAATVLGMGCTTIHSLCKIFPRQPFKPLEGEALRKFQDEMENVHFIFIDEFSMIGCRLLGWLEKRLREAKPRCDEPFGGLFVYLIGDIRQLPPVGDTTLYSTAVSESADVQRGKLVYQSFERSIILTVSQRQADESFRDALDHLSVGTSDEADFARFSARFKMNVPAAERELFRDAMHVYTKRDEVAAHNLAKLVELDEPVALLLARHNNAKAKEGSADAAQGLEKEVRLSKGSRVMLRSNLWLAAGLVNGATGTVVDIIYEPNKAPPNDLPVAVMVRFDKYSGPTMADGSVPIATQLRGWDDSQGTHCTREQFPLCLAYAITVHKAQGLTVERAVVNVGQRDFQVGLIYVAMSRVKSWDGLLLDPEFSLNRMTDMSDEKAIIMAVPVADAAGIFKSLIGGGQERGGRGQGREDKYVEDMDEGEGDKDSAVASQCGTDGSPRPSETLTLNMAPLEIKASWVHRTWTDKLSTVPSLTSGHISMNVPLDDSKKGLKTVISFLAENAKEVVVMTIPPIPRHAEEGRMEKIKHLNNFIIQEAADKDNVHVLDIFSKFLLIDGSINIDLFEKWNLQKWNGGPHSPKCTRD